ncbi:MULTISPECIES: BLUF domain-containing protein [Psychrobacter]|nr:MULTISPECIES: BLUF domain-containing protein [Psychrobacter]
MQDTPTNALIRLIYISDINTADSSVFAHIQHHSESFNKENHIAGFLCNNNESFLQCLEGTKEVVSSLMQRIFKDKNHKDVDVVFSKKISGYSFTDWRMHSINLNDSNWKKFSNHTQLTDISPFKPQHWPHWFVDHFIESVKTIDYSNLDKDLITFDKLGYSDVQKTLASNNVLFYIFLSVLISSAVAILLFRYNVIA